MPFRKDIEHLEYRRALWQYVLGVLKTVHRHRLPGRRFGPDMELLAVYGAAMVVCFSRGQFGRSTDIAKYLGTPRETVRRHLAHLVELGLIKRDGHKFRLTPVTEKMPADVKQILSDQIMGAATIVQFGQTELGHLAQRDLIERAPVFLWTALPDGTADFFNQRWCSYHNMPMREALGGGWTAILHHDDRTAYLEKWNKALRTGTVHEAQVRRRRHDGEYRWCVTRAEPARDKSGKIVKWYGTNVDINEHQLRVENLTAAVEQLHSTVQHIIV